MTPSQSCSNDAQPWYKKQQELKIDFRSVNLEMFKLSESAWYGTLIDDNYVSSFSDDTKIVQIMPLVTKTAQLRRFT